MRQNLQTELITQNDNLSYLVNEGDGWNGKQRVYMYSQHPSSETVVNADFT